jgi:LL-diaminopimelate aminotransferase
MIKGNSHFQRLKRPYIFPIIDGKLAELKETHPEAKILNMGTGDIALPLAPSISKAIEEASQEMTRPDGLHGYGPSEGYLFLREAIAQNAYPNLNISPEEICVSDGINTDIVNILDLFHTSCSIAIPNPAYPAYLDSNLLLGRKKIISMPCNEESGFVPSPPKEHCDILYLTSPHNPTGVAMTYNRLKEFVDYAIERKAIILFDGAYEAFVTSKDVPKSIYEIPGAKSVAIEFRSFSKSAGFTGLRCSYLTLPKEVSARFGKKEIQFLPLWKKRQSIKFNGVSYPIQKGAAASLVSIGKEETNAQVEIYLSSAKKLKEALLKANQTCFGGVDAPYIWWKTQNNMSSWDFFDYLLTTCGLITIPGCGFGDQGEGYVRLSTFSSKEKTEQAIQRIQQLGPL